MDNTRNVRTLFEEAQNQLFSLTPKRSFSLLRLVRAQEELSNIDGGRDIIERILDQACSGFGLHSVLAVNQNTPQITEFIHALNEFGNAMAFPEGKLSLGDQLVGKVVAFNTYPWVVKECYKEFGVESFVLVDGSLEEGPEYPGMLWTTGATEKEVETLDTKPFSREDLVCFTRGSDSSLADPGKTEDQKKVYQVMSLALGEALKKLG